MRRLTLLSKLAVLTIALVAAWGGGVVAQHVRVNGLGQFASGLASSFLCASESSRDVYWQRVAANDFGLYTGGTNCAGGTLRYDVSGSAATYGAVNLIWTSDNAQDIGASGATRPRTIYAGTSVIAPTVTAVAVNSTGTAAYQVNGVLLASVTAPVATTFCTSPSVPASNGTAAFTINVGTACASSVGTITLPTATTGWIVDCHNVTAPATNIVEQTGGTGTTATVTNYVRTTGVAGNWTDSNVLRCTALAY